VLQNLAYYLTLPLLFGVSYLPMWLLYRISDVFYFLIYYVVGYRKKVVFQNLRRSFPEKSEKEIEAIAKGFYEYFCDFLVETVKAFTISKETLLKRVTLDTGGIYKKLEAEGRASITAMGHYGNWEWGALAYSATNTYQLNTIYKRLPQAKFEALVYKMRVQFGVRPVEMNEVFKTMVRRIKHEKHAGTFCFLTDQTPHPDFAYWTNFLNQDTPVFPGTEKMARKFNLPVVFVNIHRVRRGHYHLTAEMLAEDPKALPEGEITERHTRRLEQAIVEHPAPWLWSHKRWKYVRPANLPSRTLTYEKLKQAQGNTRSDESE